MKKSIKQVVEQYVFSVDELLQKLEIEHAEDMTVENVEIKYYSRSSVVLVISKTVRPV